MGVHRTAWIESSMDSGFVLIAMCVNAYIDFDQMAPCA